MRSGLSFALPLLLVGCVTPRSMTLGMMAAPVGRGTEVGVFSGVGYSAQTGPVVTTTNVAGEQSNQQTQNRAFSIPAFEANVQKGFNDHVALNFHVSPAGVQPGLKWTVNRSRVAHFAILPAIAFGYGSVATSDFVAQPTGAQSEINPRATTSFTFLGGLKLLVSHQSGFYAGVGYDFVFNRSNSSSAPNANADRTDVITQTSTHQLMGAVGFSIALGQVSLRPEIAFAVNPALSQTISSRVGAASTGDQTLSGGFSWAILPGFTIAVATPPTKAGTDEEEDERPTKREDEEEDDDDERPKKKGPARKKTSDDDDDTPRRRRSADDDTDD
ncbi:MAG: hypothetical protein IAE78_04110 [Myxococcus sp.]|nr:hypothetical protein [Myxococcus sp.]